MELLADMAYSKLSTYKNIIRFDCQSATLIPCSVFNIELTHLAFLYMLGQFPGMFTSKAYVMLPHGQKEWLVLYKAALLESDLQKMPLRIVLAGRAIQRRLHELQGCSGHYGERLEIQYAIRNLKAAERMK